MIEPRELEGHTVAYVLIKAELGMAKTVAEKVSDFEDVLWADVITGEYDVIAAVCVPDNAALGDLVIERIQTVTGVKNPSTVVVSRHYVIGQGHASFP